MSNNIEIDNEVSINYEKEYKRCQEIICKMKEEHEEQLQEETRFYNQILTQKDKEIEWYKNVINGILHI